VLDSLAAAAFGVHRKHFEGSNLGLALQTVHYNYAVIQGSQLGLIAGILLRLNTCFGTSLGSCTLCFSFSIVSSRCSRNRVVPDPVTLNIETLDLVPLLSIRKEWTFI